MCITAKEKRVSCIHCNLNFGNNIQPTQALIHLADLKIKNQVNMGNFHDPLRNFVIFKRMLTQ